MHATVVDNSQTHRYEMWAEDQLCFIDYRRKDNVVNLLYAKVPAALAGRGHGAALVKGALQLIQQQHQCVIASCSLVATYIRRHPEFQSLLIQS